MVYNSYVTFTEAETRAGAKWRTEYCEDSAPRWTWQSHTWAAVSRRFTVTSPHAIFAFRQAEPALYFHTLTLVPVILDLVLGFAFLGPSQSRT